ncbi:MAG: SxtJ family membrane protein [Gemmatimonadota bacterium]|nr:SxtJ family membrane protein [Gemmatimonadota bacterium]
MQAPSAYTATQGRRFAFTIASAFGMFALLLLWRDSETVGRILGGLAAVLALAGAVAPSRLGPVEEGWMRFAHALSRVTTPVFMGIVYFVVLTPAGLIRRTFGSNPLIRDGASGSYWFTRTSADRETRRRKMERQF